MRSIERDSVVPLDKLSFREMIDHTKFLRSKNRKQKEMYLVQSAEYVRSQMPNRIAKLIVHLKNLPYGVSDVPIIQKMISDYVLTYHRYVSHKPISSTVDLAQFTYLLKELLLTHSMSIPCLSFGLLEKSYEMQQSEMAEFSDGHELVHSSSEDEDSEFSTYIIDRCPYINDFIDQFSEARLATRVIVGHQLTLHNQLSAPEENAPVTGIFEEESSIIKYLQKAIDDATMNCKIYYEGVVPPRVNVHDFRKYVSREHDEFVFLPEHIHHMMFELLKNSFKAVVDTHGNPNNKKRKLPDIDIVVVNNIGNDSITIKISDKGGGIPRKHMPNIWLYSYTTALGIRSQMDQLKKMIITAADFAADLDKIDKVDRAILGAVNYAPMFGLGYGLPIVKLYSTYNGGDIKIQSVAGYGTDAYLYLTNLKECEETV